jgi:two-component system cell cycle sensor histidine kinase/response regulator CckA
MSPTGVATLELNSDPAGTILVVDNTDAGREVVSRLLRRSGYHVVEAASGVDALERAQESVDLVLLDVRLPDIQGTEVCRRLKLGARTAMIPVVHLSASALTADDKVRGLDGGADAYLTHPIEPELLLATVRAMLRLRRAANRLAQARRMEAVGRLAGGVAHDFNNLLTVILDYSRMVLEGGTLEPNIREPIEEIAKAGEEAATVTRQLLAFSRQQPAFPRLMDVNALLMKMRKAMHFLLGEEVELVLDLAPGELNVIADPAHLEQVLFMLLDNAAEAMARQGRVSISTRTIVLLPAVAPQHESAPGEYLRITVADNGRGMDAETVKRVFEPFFTTKSMGRGTGLGLATVYGTVRQSAGFLTVESVPGQGTSFHVHLPLAPSEFRVVRGPEASYRGEEMLLLLDDERSVRSFSAAALRRLGYSVAEAATTAEALDALRQAGGAIRAVVCATDMLEVEWTKFLQVAQETNPGVRMLLTAGHVVDDEGGAILGRLFKPYTATDLARKVRELLDRTEAPEKP